MGTYLRLLLGLTVTSLGGTLSTGASAAWPTILGVDWMSIPGILWARGSNAAKSCNYHGNLTHDPCLRSNFTT